MVYHMIGAGTLADLDTNLEGKISKVTHETKYWCVYCENIDQLGKYG